MRAVGAILRRIGVFAVTLLVASILVFVLLSVLPGDPARSQLGLDATDAEVAALRTDLGLDRPAPVRYVEWVWGFLRGDLGTSLTSRTPVADQVFPALGLSLVLVLCATVLAVALAVPLGTLAAQRHRKPDGVAFTVITQLGVALPNFLLALLLIAVFSVRLGWLPSGGWPVPGSGAGAVAAALVLPTLSLGLVRAAILARYMRSAALDVQREDFIRTSRATGRTAAGALWRHGLRSALLPVVTVTGVEFSALVIGAVVIENVFVLPGMGTLLLRSVAGRDLATAQAVVMLIVALVLVVNLLVDIAQTWIDPRLRGRA